MNTGNTRTFDKKEALEFVGVYAEKGGFTYIYGKYYQRDEQCDLRNFREEFLIQILRVSSLGLYLVLNDIL